MVIKDSELEDVRKVLAEKVKRAWAAEHYSNRLRLLVAVAIMQGAEVKDSELIEGQGIYGYLIHELAVQPAAPAPAGEWPRDEYGRQNYPEWHEGIYHGRFVDASANHGFHEPQPRSRGTHAVHFVGSEEFDAILDPKTRARCRKWFDEARRALVARDKRDAAEAKAREAAKTKLRDGFKRVLRDHSRTVELPGSVSRTNVESLVIDLQKLLKDTQL